MRIEAVRIAKIAVDEASTVLPIPFFAKSVWASIEGLTFNGPLLLGTNFRDGLRLKSGVYFFVIINRGKVDAIDVGIYFEIDP